MHAFDYVVAETERQSGTMREAVGMYHAWQAFKRHFKNGYRLNKGNIEHAIRCIHADPAYTHRLVPAVFHQGTPAVPPGEQLERAMDRWYRLINSSQVDAKGRDSLFPDSPADIADYVTREFLLIHPFADGNGRVGSLVWNFLNESIGHPQMMPYFFGKS